MNYLLQLLVFRLDNHGSDKLKFQLNVIINLLTFFNLPDTLFIAEYTSGQGIRWLLLRRNHLTSYK
jgi:hypothetical protein